MKDKTFNIIPEQQSKQKCLHDACTKCKGTGVTPQGIACIHMISCPCPKCSPQYKRF